MLPTSWPPIDGIRAPSDLLANSKNRSNFSTRNPKAIIAIDVRTHARNVRSFAAWSVYRSIIIADLSWKGVASALQIGDCLCAAGGCYQHPPATTCHQPLRTATDDRIKPIKKTTRHSAWPWLHQQELS